jgi:hypothetical protein
MAPQLDEMFDLYAIVEIMGVAIYSVHVVSLVDTPILQYINDTLQFSKSIMI